MQVELFKRTQLRLPKDGVSRLRRVHEMAEKEVCYV